MTKRPKVAFLVNGTASSAMGERAQAFASRLSESFEIAQIYRPRGRLTAPLGMLRQLLRFRPQLCYVFDMAVAGVMAAGLYRSLTGRPFIVDTGDDIVALGEVLGRRGISLYATRQLEQYALRHASQIVVRGTGHREVLFERGIDAVVIPDGVDLQQFTPPATPRTRGDNQLTIGLVGSSIWIPARQTCYGLELVELIRILRQRLPDWEIRGLMIGDGTGIPILQERCRDYGITEFVEFAGRVPYAELPQWLHRMDIALSTQTNDAVGRVRTTGKLPLYLATGRFILATRVGEAARVLPEEMLVDYAGSSDPDYAERLAEHLFGLLEDGTIWHVQAGRLAERSHMFCYEQLSQSLACLLDQNLNAPTTLHATCP